MPLFGGGSQFDLSDQERMILTEMRDFSIKSASVISVYGIDPRDAVLLMQGLHSKGLVQVESRLEPTAYDPGPFYQITSKGRKAVR